MLLPAPEDRTSGWRRQSGPTAASVNLDSQIEGRMRELLVSGQPSRQNLIDDAFDAPVETRLSGWRTASPACDGRGDGISEEALPQSIYGRPVNPQQLGGSLRLALGHGPAAQRAQDASDGELAFARRSRHCHDGDPLPRTDVSSISDHQNCSSNNREHKCHQVLPLRNSSQATKSRQMHCKIRYLDWFLLAKTLITISSICDPQHQRGSRHHLKISRLRERSAANTRQC